mgnify:CR=1 FL=1
MRQYIRYLSLQINGDTFIENQSRHNLRCVFTVSVYPHDAMSVADIRIYNLNQGSIIENGSSVVLTAGYEDDYDEIFTGTVINSLKERDSVNTVTRLTCRSTSISQRGSISGTYGQGALLVDVLRDLAQQYPIHLDIDESQFDDNPSFPSGYAINGDIPKELDSLADRFGFTWVVDRGSLIITRDGKERSLQPIDVNQDTGMVGFPEINRGPQGLGVYVVTRIKSAIRANSKINVQSDYATYNTGNLSVSEVSGDTSANGEYNVLSLRYEGDTHGDEWNLHIDAIRPNTGQVQSAVGIDQIDGSELGGALVWGNRVSQEFRNKVREIGGRLRINPNWLMAVMAFETNYSFSPSIPNAAGSGAIGLIQFMPGTARGLGTSTQQLAGMTAVQQLDYVERFYQPYANKIRSLYDAYVAVFYPAALDKPDDFVIFTRPSVGYTQNASLDLDRDGKITKRELGSVVVRAYNLGVPNSR